MTSQSKQQPAYCLLTVVKFWRAIHLTPVSNHFRWPSWIYISTFMTWFFYSMSYWIVHLILLTFWQQSDLIDQAFDHKSQFFVFCCSSVNFFQWVFDISFFYFYYYFTPVFLYFLDFKGQWQPPFVYSVYFSFLFFLRRCSELSVPSLTALPKTIFFATLMV